MVLGVYKKLAGRHLERLPRGGVLRVSELQTVESRRCRTAGDTSLGYAYALWGKRREAQAVIEELKERSKRRYISPTIIAFIYAGLGEKNEAFAWLEKAYAGRDFILVLHRVDPSFDPLRPDPRFADLVRRVCKIT